MDSQWHIVQEAVGYFSGLPGVRGVALVGSLAAGRHVDEHSDVDLMVCIDEAELAGVMQGDWLQRIAPVALLFPMVLEKEIRVFFEGYIEADFHFYFPRDFEEAQGVCELGSYIRAGFKPLYDPEGLLIRTAARIEPEHSDDGPFEINAGVFWFNLVYISRLISRGDLFRAYRMMNGYMPLWLLGMIERVEPIPGDKYKRVQERLRPDLYDAWATCFSRLERDDMAKAMQNGMRFFWRIQEEFCPEMPQESIAVFRGAENMVTTLLSRC